MQTPVDPVPSGVGLRSRSVLLIDPDLGTRSWAASVLESERYAVMQASTLPEAKELLQEAVPDAVLVDIIRWSREKCEAFIRELKNCSRLRSTAVIVLSNSSRSRIASAAIKVGANDCIEKPLRPDILLAKLETHLYYRQTLLRLERGNELLHHFDAIDHLTRLFNRRALNEAIRIAVAQASQARSCIAILLIHIDDFNAVIDQFGDRTAEETLRKTGTILHGVLREGDLIGRWGGEEFCAVLSRINSEDVVLVAERLRGAVESSLMTSHMGERFSVTASIGIAWTYTCEEKYETFLVETANRALCDAQKQGRNLVVMDNLEMMEDLDII